MVISLVLGRQKLKAFGYHSEEKLRQTPIRLARVQSYEASFPVDEATTAIVTGRSGDDNAVVGAIAPENPVYPETTAQRTSSVADAEKLNLADLSPTETTSAVAAIPTAADAHPENIAMTGTGENLGAIPPAPSGFLSSAFSAAGSLLSSAFSALTTAVKTTLGQESAPVIATTRSTDAAVVSTTPETISDAVANATPVVEPPATTEIPVSPVTESEKADEPQGKTDSKEPDTQDIKADATESSPDNTAHANNGIGNGEQTAPGASGATWGGQHDDDAAVPGVSAINEVVHAKTEAAEREEGQEAAVKIDVVDLSGTEPSPSGKAAAKRTN